MTCGGHEAFTSTTIFKICGGKSSSGGQECYILKTHLESHYPNSCYNVNVNLAFKYYPNYFNLHLLSLTLVGEILIGFQDVSFLSSGTNLYRTFVIICCGGGVRTSELPHVLRLWLG